MDRFRTLPWTNGQQEWEIIESKSKGAETIPMFMYFITHDLIQYHFTDLVVVCPSHTASFHSAGQHGVYHWLHLYCCHELCRMPKIIDRCLNINLTAPVQASIVLANIVSAIGCITIIVMSSAKCPRLLIDAWTSVWQHQCKRVSLYVCRVDSRFAPSQRETALLCNDVSHWLGASLESALYMLCLVCCCQGGEPDISTVAKMVLNDWQRGKIPFFVKPPGCDVSNATSWLVSTGFCDLWAPIQYKNVVLPVYEMPLWR